MSAAAPRLPDFFDLIAFTRIDSTNEEARRRALAGAREGTLVWALEQTAGRGRRGRAWQSPPGNLYMSLLLRPGCPLETAAQWSFVAAVALGEALAGVLPPGPAIRFKWPNDVLIDGAKVSGILMETSGGAATVEWLVVGIGVNVLSAPAEAPYPATSLVRAGAAAASVPAVLERLAGALLAWRERWLSQGFAVVRAQWLRFAQGLGHAVEVRLPGETLCGRFAALEEGGALALELPGGGVRRITAGEVFFPGQRRVD
ncbi:MAG: biotin--[acetyl-CoA-carboxylase] ligase [Rhodospirillaceae bacterium]|nr:biotin--[acetyl-CoA-carboxylase] ligase [Rhodospirillaceae bacterium]